MSSLVRVRGMNGAGKGMQYRRENGFGEEKSTFNLVLGIINKK
jgi:hypothetical protein